MLKAFIIFSLTIFTTSFYSTHDHNHNSDHQHTSNCFPENDLKFPADQKSAGGISKEEFNLVLDEFEAVMNLEVSRVDAARLVVERRWETADVNAMAYQSGSYRYIVMYGGLARHPDVTSDAFRLVACHELGHHLGGAPKKLGGYWGGSSWASNEGQADYYASLKCFRRLVIEGRKLNQAVAGPDLSQYPETELNYAKAECAKSFTNSDDQEICVRATMGGYAIGRMFASFGSTTSISLHTPNPTVVTRTNDNHPESQCRTDTYFQGAICDVSYRNDVSNNDERYGTCNQKDNHARGLRPLCWHKPSA